MKENALLLVGTCVRHLLSFLFISFPVFPPRERMVSFPSATMMEQSRWFLTTTCASLGSGTKERSRTTHHITTTRNQSHLGEINYSLRGHRKKPSGPRFVLFFSEGIVVISLLMLRRCIHTKYMHCSSLQPTCNVSTYIS